MWAGASRQHPSRRFRGQVQEAKNTLMSVRDGAGKRPGSHHIAEVTGLSASADLRQHEINRDENEQYVVLYGDGVLRVFDVSGTEATVTVDTDAQAYLDLNDAGPNDFVFTTFDDFTIIANKLVPMAAHGAAPASTTTKTDYSALLAINNPDPDVVYEVQNDEDGHLAGYYKKARTVVRYWTYTDTGSPTPAVILIDEEETELARVEFGATVLSIDADSDGNVIIGGSSSEYRIRKYDTTGTLLWSYDHPGTTANPDVNGMCIDEDGTIFCAGQRNTATASAYGSDAGLYAVTPGGAAKWRDDVIGGQGLVDPTNGVDMEAVCVDEDYVYVTGTGSNKNVYWRYDKETGDNESEVTDSALDSASTLWSAIAVDENNVYVAHYAGTNEHSGGTDVHVAAYNKSTGANVWRTDLGTPTVGINELRIHDGKLWGIGDDTGAANYYNIYEFNVSTGAATGYQQTSSAIDNDDFDITEDGKIVVSGERNGSDGNIRHATVDDPDTLSTESDMSFDGRAIGVYTAWDNPNVDSNGWYKVPKPGDPEAYLTAEFMPVKMVRTSTSPLTFRVSLIDWVPRTSGDADTNPIPEIFNSGKTIEDMVFHRNRFGIMSDEIIQWSQSGDFFNFFIEEWDNVVDSDPIRVNLQGERVTIGEYLVPFRKTVVAFTKAAEQYEMSAPDVLDQDSASMDQAGSYESMRDVRPKRLGRQIYFANESGGEGQIWEYLYDDLSLQNVANEVTAHVPGYLPTDIKTLFVCKSNNLVGVLPEDDYRIYVYFQFWSDEGKKAQQAWGVYEFDSNDRIVDVSAINNIAYMFVENGNGTYEFRKLPLTHEAVETDMPFRVHLDCKSVVTGTHSGGETTFDYGYDDDTIDTIILGPDWSEAGATLGTVTRVNDQSIKVDGDYSADSCIVGRSYTEEIELSELFVFDPEGNAVIEGWLQYVELLMNYEDTGNFQVEWSQPGKTTRTKDLATIDDGDAGSLASGEMRVSINGRSDNTTIKILNSSHRPSLYHNLEMVTDFIRRR